MGKTDRDDSPYLPPQLRQSFFDEVTANEISIVPSGFSFKFIFFAIACNLMFSGATELFRSGDGRAEFGAETLYFMGRRH
jgi:hypothetical protein